MALPVPSSATVVFSAYADLDIYDAPCGFGVLKAFATYHSGTVHSYAGGDSGRGFQVDGGLSVCSSTFDRASCSNGGTVGTNTTVSCSTYTERNQGSCSSTPWQAKTDVGVTDGGGESAFDASGCQTC